MTTKNITEATFDAEVLQSERPVVVDFWAPWCGPCLQVAPVLDQIATENAQSITVVKVNTDDEPAIAARYGITSLPTIAVYSQGEMVKSIVGAKPKPLLLRELSEWLA
jgi:thioredoxin 1